LARLKDKMSQGCDNVHVALPGDTGAAQKFTSYFFRIRSISKMGKKGKKGLSKKPGERTIKSMANAVSSDEGEADGQDMVGGKKSKPI